MEGAHRESRRCSRDTYPEAYITKYTSIRRLGLMAGAHREELSVVRALEGCAREPRDALPLRGGEREFFIDNLLVRIHFIIVMIRWTGLAPWEFEFPLPDSRTSTFLVPLEGCAREPRDALPLL